MRLVFFGKGWLVAFALLSVSFIVIAAAAYFAPDKKLCKGPLPFGASWEASFNGSEVKYFYNEDANTMKARISFGPAPGGNGALDYLEIFDKGSAKSYFYYLDSNGCTFDTVEGLGPYFDPFAVSDCIPGRHHLIRINDYNTPSGMLDAPRNCTLRNTKDARYSPYNFGSSW
ncbi:Uncharacterised protein [uncultured archaeon]|nr:Uncharacterised protein [uncultured archaeon]